MSELLDEKRKAMESDQIRKRRSLNWFVEFSTECILIEDLEVRLQDGGGKCLLLLLKE